MGMFFYLFTGLGFAWGFGCAAMPPYSAEAVYVAPDPFYLDLLPEPQRLLEASDCIGPIISSVCRGAVVPSHGREARCYGALLDGVCTGPVL